MRIIEEIQLDFKDVLIAPQKTNISSRSQVNLFREFKFKHSPLIINAIPLIAANMDGCGTISMAEKLYEHGCMTALHKHYEEDKLIGFFKSPISANTFYSTGITDADIAKFNYVYANSDLRMVCLDLANGYMKKFVDFCLRFKDNNPNLVVMAGNVVSGEMVKELSDHVDIVKVNIGNGSVCTTRLKAGVGRPTLSTIIDCAQAAKESGIMICSDGGCTVPGDIGKAFCAGASLVMIGGMLAAHSECELELLNGKYKFYGMSSEEAMNKHSGGVAKHRAAEGKLVYLKDRGPVENTILDILGGLRSTGSYIGCDKIEDFSKNSVFYRVNNKVNEIFGKE